MRRVLKIFSIFFMMIVFSSPAFGAEWGELMDKHFIVHYAEGVGTENARQVMRRAEEYYTRIADRIGFTRYADFWTWEERVKIFVYADQKSFVQGTGQPLWSLGYADRDARLLKSRSIVTYLQEDNFFDGVLPHEIGHLIVRDFLGPSVKIPLWFDEGVAQLQEGRKASLAGPIMRRLVGQRRHWPLREMMNVDIRREKNKQRVNIFYAQSVSVIDFMLTSYGQEAFGRLCRTMAKGVNFEEALSKAYPGTIPDLETLEKKWVDSLK